MISANQQFWVIVIGISIFGILLRSLSAILLPFIVGFIGAYILNHFVSFLERLKISRGIGSAFTILSLLTFLVLLVLVAMPYLQQQIFYFAQAIPSLAEETFTALLPLLEKASLELGTPAPNELKKQIATHLGDVLPWIIGFLTNLATNSMAIANLLSLVILSPVVTFYMLKDWPKLIARIDSWLPYRYVDTIRGHALEMDRTLFRYAKGQSMVCLILMVLYATALWGIGLPQGGFVGVLTGLLSFIPYVGMLIGLLTSLGIGFAHFVSWGFVGQIFLVFITIGLIEGNILTPRFVGERIGLHPVWIIFALLAGGTWFGFVGVLLAIPVSAIIGVLVRIIIQWYLSTPFYQKA